MRVDRTPSVVVLPAPFGPSKPTISPGPTSKEISSRTGRLPRSATSRLTEMAGEAVTRRKHSARTAIRRYPCVTKEGGDGMPSPRSYLPVVAAVLAAFTATAVRAQFGYYQLPKNDFIWNWGDPERNGMKFEDFTVNGG